MGAVIASGVAVCLTNLVLRNHTLAGVRYWLLPAITVLVAVASSAVVRVRLRSATVGTSWTDPAIVICVVTVPPAWVPVCVGVGVFGAKLLGRVSANKAAYNAAKDSLAAATALLVAVPLGVAAGISTTGTRAALGHPASLVAVAVTVALAQYAIGVPVLAVASAARWTQVVRHGGLTKVLAFIGKFAVALLTLRLAQVDVRLLAVIPSIALCLHLLYASRVRARAEGIAWQRLAATTEELNATNLDVVLAAAVTNAASLFSADEAEVFVRDGPDGPVLVRGNADGVIWSGEPGAAPTRTELRDAVTMPLAGHDRKADLGEVRLYFAGRVDLTERERLTLRTFVSALRTAVRNAAAFAETRRLASRNAHAAMHDPLTGLANRRRLTEHGDTLLGQPGVTALIVMDLDRFRDINETLGHLAGDRLLVEVARRLTGVTTAADIVARLGADEFAVLFLGLPSAAGAEQRARQLLATLDAPVDVDDIRVLVEASAGIAVLDPLDAVLREAGLVELLRRADVARYQAKRGGPRIVRYEPARDTADIAQLMLGGDLPRAVAEREFTVNFQPIVDLHTGVMISAEALARWHHPERGDLDPRRFLAAVERSGLLPAFAEAVLDQALVAMRRWRALGIDAPVAVNASPRSLLDPTYPRMIRSLLAAHDVPGSQLVVELTESLTLGQVEMIGGVLAQLREAGVRLALDDFGTGYSSLAMLAKIPVYELKIDRGFVAAMAGSAEAAAVVRSTIELGRSLDLLVVGEGVENEEQRRVLWELGCPAGQGHLFARPLPADLLLDRLAAGVDGRLGRLTQPLRGGTVD
jgi:diguanylate cyclase (GGDEF)-like protein